jgi:uncharacterized membrane protein
VWQANLGLLVGVTVVVFAITYGFAFALGILQGILESGDVPEAAAGVAIVGNLISNLIQIFLGIGQAQIALKLARGQHASFGDLFNGGGRFLPVLGSSIIAGIALTVGVMLCIIPGIIMALMFWPFYWLVVDEKAPALESFSVAYMLTQRNLGTTFLLWLLSVGIMIVGVLALCVGIVAAAPLVTMLWASAYLMMSGQLSSYPTYGKY